MQELASIVEGWLQEDIGEGDVTTQATIEPSVHAVGRFLCKQDGVVSGIFVVEEVFRQISPNLVLEWKVSDGDSISKGQVFGTVSGPAFQILQGERVALNILQRTSGISSLSHAMAKAADAGASQFSPTHKCYILDTRKTVPGLRTLDKYAVKCGGAANHRIGLYDMVMIKDNHITAAGGIGAAILKVKEHLEKLGKFKTIKIEVETRTLSEVQEALEYKGIVDRIMLDNMTRLLPDGKLDSTMLEEAIRIIDGRVETEASGNITLETVQQTASAGVDFISSGALTHSVQALDISLKISLLDQ